jgi:predicted enzyme related to lactoylglutathione lyase
VVQSVSLVAFLVRDYDEAIAYFTGALAFTLREDSDLGAGKRWVRVASVGGRGAELLLAKATGDQEAYVGNQTGGRVFLFLQTEDFRTDYDRMKAAGVHFVEAPRHEPYGWVVVFTDLYGNKWDLVEAG